MESYIKLIESKIINEITNLNYNFYNGDYSKRDNNCLKFLDKYSKILEKIENEIQNSENFEQHYLVGKLYLQFRNSYCFRFYHNHATKVIEKKILEHFNKAISQNDENKEILYQIARYFLVENDYNIRKTGHEILQNLENDNTIEIKLKNKIAKLKNYIFLNVILYNDDSIIWLLDHKYHLEKAGIKCQIISDLDDMYDVLALNQNVIICDLPFHNKENEDKITNIFKNNNSIVLKIASTPVPEDERTKQFLEIGFDLIYNVRFQLALVPIGEFIFSEIYKKLRV